MTALNSLSDTSSSSLPTWDLKDLYTSFTAPEVEKDIQKVQNLVKEFQAYYENKFTSTNSWTGAELIKAITEYEIIEELLSKLMSYAFLCFATQMQENTIQQFYQKIQEKVTTISSDILFFTLDLNNLEDSALTQVFTQSSELQRYKPWIEGIRLFRPHQLSSEMERLLHEKSVTGRKAWVRLFEETLASIKFSFQGKDLFLAEILNFFSHSDRQIRQEASQAIAQGLTSRLPIFTLVTNTLSKDKEIEDTWRRYPHMVASRNLSNRVEDEVVEALSNAVKNSYGRLSHRYYALKAQWMGLEKLEYWDRNAPLPEAPEVNISWEESRDIILQAYGEFSPKMAEIGKKFFDNNWIDAAPKAGKESGAFAHPVVPSAHPYLLVNFQGKLRDVMTLAHELGHGIHQVLAATQGPLLSDTPLTIAETASVFGEMLTFRSLLRKTQDTAQRRSLLAAKVEDMLNTVIRQIAFFEFEKQVHERRRHQELTAQDLEEIWLKTQKEALGEGVNIDPIVGCFWAYISHFIHTPFYVYAYAFGDCLVNSLYALYEQGQDNFIDNYHEMLSSGGSKQHTELLAPFGLSAKKSDFWQQGLNLIASLIDELETLSKAA